MSRLAAGLARAVDGAVLWRLGLIGVGGDVDPGAPAPEPDAVWREARLDGGRPLDERELPRRWRRRHAGLRPRVVELVGESRGPGDHWGATHLRARAVLHPDAGAPTVIVLHGYAVPTAWYEERTMAQLLRRGISAVRVELPFHLSRRVPGRSPGAGFFSSDLSHTTAVLVQATEDVAAVAAWARRRAGPVGVHGVSLGGLVGSLYAALRPVESAVLVTPPCDLAHVILETAPLRVRRRLGVVDGRGGPWAADAAAARLLLGERLAGVTPHRLPLRTDGRRVVLVVADHDHIVGADPVRELGARWGADVWSYGHGHVTVMTARGLSTRLQERMARDLGLDAVPLEAAG